jgi:hypothetical protein
VEQAERELAGHDPRSATAAAQAASDTATALNATLDRYGATRAALVQARTDAVQLSSAGYRMEASQGAIDGARVALTEAARALQQDGPPAAAVKIKAAETMLAEAVANGTGLVALRQQNEQRLAAVEAEGKAAADLIAAGRQAFDLVDEFAESTWGDIRGNGSEAQASADRAHQHWLSAGRRNTMDVQEFHEARDDLEAASQELAYTRQLIDAITTRLRDLEQARDSARASIDEAARSLSAGRAFVLSNDPDVGNDPEDKLAQAEQLLAAAQAEAARPKPDWLALVRDAHAADALADQALAGARSEAEAMAKLRQQVAQAGQAAAAEVSKALKFAELHRADIQQATMGALSALKSRLDQAQAAEQRASALTEDQRRAAYTQAAAAYRAAQDEGGKVYQAAYSDFQRLEKLRGELNDELAKARGSLSEAQMLAGQHQGRVPAASRKRLEAAQVSFDQIRLPISGEAQLGKTIKLAQTIESEARAVENELRRITGTQVGQPGVGEVIGGMVIGEILGSGRRQSSGWGGSGSWSGGSGGGNDGWGKMGGGGGSFGGGGGGGSFGGGGGGGGGW